MASRKTQLRFIALAAALLAGCSQTGANKNALRKQAANTPARPVTPKTIFAVGDVKTKNAQMGASSDIVTLQMMQKNGALYLVGRPIGFAKWDVASDPESPYPTFTASDNILNFVPNGKWIVDYFAGGALGVVGNLAFMSGAVGMSIVDMSRTEQPKEIGRHPFQDPNADQVVKDAEGAFSYKAIIPNPSNPGILYGFREQDYVYTLNVNYSQKDIVNASGKTYDNGPKVTPIRKEAYGPNGVCCVTGGALFAGRAFVAFRSALWIFGISSNGALGQPSVINSLQAYNVQASDRFVYIHHVPSYSAGISKPAGIYVFNQQGNQVAFLPVSPERFAVSNDDQYLFANVDNASVRIFRMTWAPR